MRRTAISFAAAAIAVSALAPAAQAAETAVAKPLPANWNLNKYKPTQAKAQGRTVTKGRIITVTGILRDTTPGDIAVAKLDLFTNPRGIGRPVKTFSVDTAKGKSFTWKVPGTAVTKLYAVKSLRYTDNKVVKTKPIRIK
ncbi:hypothetical protein ACGFNU_27940 [Spirillospora sp. NPDC048911]|uniref:hypothetical protein n=1 Tax=Spirillospora sp. NPDC048911 TaxID=3364527 RepID=UPI003720E05A